MPLKVPENGLHLGAGKDSTLPPQAFAVQLSDNVIENMIKCVQDGGDLSLDLGSDPTFRYGSKSHRVSAPRDTAPLDLYLTKPFESTRTAERLPNTSSLFRKLASPTKGRAKQIAAAADSSQKQPSGKSSTSSGIDSDMETLKDNLAAHDRAVERTHVVNKAPSTKKSLPKAKGQKLLSGGYNAAPRSLPASPALNGIGSPSSTSALTPSQQLMERKREQRSPLVHELAARDRTVEYLRGEWTGSSDDFKEHLDKASEPLPDSNKRTLKTMYWKELNVWDYDYTTQEDRQQAIDNAIRRYDKQRLGPTEPEWQKLLPKEERGVGKCLSKLQAKLDRPAPPQPTPTPKIKVQKAEDSSSSKDSGDTQGLKTKARGEPMSRSGSGTLPGKVRKPAVQESLLKKTANPKARSAVQKLSPTKTKGSLKSNGSRILSQEIIYDSDSSGGDPPVATKAPAKKMPVTKPPPSVKVAAPVRESATAKDTLPSKPRPQPKPQPKEPIKSQPTKRRREEDDGESSSSGTPLMHRLTAKQTRPNKPQNVEHSQSSRASAAAPHPVKNKNTSPTKSSPLASSPPTNASDLEEDGPPVSKKRKAESSAKETTSKRQGARIVPVDVVTKAHKFKLYYEQYEALHYEISALDNPPSHKMTDLLDMRIRLQDMKKEIYEKCASDRD